MLLKTRFAVTVLVLCTATEVCFGQVEGYVTDDGFIALSFASQVYSQGADFISSGRHLVPIPPGDTDASADPYTFLLANSERNVSYAAIPGTTIELGPEDWVTNVMYTGPLESCSEDLAGSTFGESGIWQASLPFRCSVPEPSDSNSTWLVIGCLALLRRRVRRSKCS